MNSWIAERELIHVTANGKRSTVTLRIGAPYRASDVDWACPVQADGLYSRLADIHGVDAFQALMLAQKVLWSLLAKVKDDGGRLLHADDDSPVDVSELFARGV